MTRCRVRRASRKGLIRRSRELPPAGAILGLLAMGETVNVSSMIGLVALFGICAQNDILLLGKINDLRREGRSLRDAVLEGARVRFRPILMTDLVMIVGVLPLVLRGGTGSELHRPLAIVYIGGFVGALVLRVFIVPVLYEAMASFFDRPGSAAGTPDADEAPRV
jgi:multidrug efflux pump subunit AcrB